VPLAPRNLGSLISPASSGSTAISLDDTSTANGINDEGQIVGFSSAYGGDPLDPPPEIQEHAFISPGSGLVDIAPTRPNGQLYLQSFYAFKINAAGQIVGLDPQTGQIALWQPTAPNATSGAWSDLFGAYDQASTHGGAAIDGAGAVAGLAPTTGGLASFETWTPSTANTTSGATSTSIVGNGYGVTLYSTFAAGNGFGQREPFAPTIDINDEGQIVGEHDGHATLVVRPPSSTGTGVGVTLDDLVASGAITDNRGQPLTGWALQRATAINREGQIVGYAQVNGKRRAFLLSPPVVSVINAISPSIAIAGRSFTLDVQGHGYLRDSQVSINGVALATTVLSPTHVQASVGSGAFHVGSNYVQIYNPEAGSYSDEVWLQGVQSVTRPHP
jgi:probable HAF family extracellular repeat protein